ncbi:MAG: flagellar biosynthesis anti-sigma factor FlgM [Candidatus Hydrogenedentes bacterium]|nr:flagellar biosynthesis anti-sigma factor FlgM [Candidatus Hydrogenedentota bacterium]
MDGIRGIGGIPEPTPERPADVRAKRRDEPSTAPVSDDLLISSEAQAAASIARLMLAAKAAPDVRPERVAAAKEGIERGDYKRPEVVAEVARRVSRFLP